MHSFLRRENEEILVHGLEDFPGEFTRQAQHRPRSVSATAAGSPNYLIRGVSLGSMIRSIVDEVDDLFSRVEATGSARRKNLMMIAYADMLAKLLVAVDDRYLKDIIDHPELWDRPGERVEEVAAALDAVRNQILDNTRQVNASRDLDFQVALDTLLQGVNRPSLSDAYGDPSPTASRLMLRPLDGRGVGGFEG